MSTTKRLTLSYRLEGDHDFLVRRRDLSDYDQYIKNKVALEFATSKHVLSVGCGDGYIDSFLGQDCMPDLQSYTGIYPVAGHCELFMQRMRNQCPEIDVSIICGDPTDLHCNRLSHKPDTIIIWHFLYHITNVKALFMSCLRQLQDGGNIVVTLAKPGCFWSQVLDKVHGTPTYNSDDFLADLLKMGVKKNDVGFSINVKEYYDVTNPTQEMYDSMLEKKANEREIEVIKEVFNRNTQHGILTQSIVTFVIPKSAFPRSLYSKH